jgi:hypothetical protein
MDSRSQKWWRNARYRSRPLLRRLHDNAGDIFLVLITVALFGMTFYVVAERVRSFEW